MVSYSNYKRHLKNAHPSINHEDFVTEEEGEQQPKYLGHQVDDDDLDQNNLVVDGDERGDQVKYIINFRNKLENEQGCQSAVRTTSATSEASIVDDQRGL